MNENQTTPPQKLNPNNQTLELKPNPLEATSLTLGQQKARGPPQNQSTTKQPQEQTPTATPTRNIGTKPKTKPKQEPNPKNLKNTKK